MSRPIADICATGKKIRERARSSRAPPVSAARRRALFEFRAEAVNETGACSQAQRDRPAQHGRRAPLSAQEIIDCTEATMRERCPAPPRTTKGDRLSDQTATRRADLDVPTLSPRVDRTDENSNEADNSHLRRPPA